MLVFKGVKPECRERQVHLSTHQHSFSQPLLSPGMCTFHWVGPSMAFWGHCFLLRWRLHSWATGMAAMKTSGAGQHSTGWESLWRVEPRGCWRCPASGRPWWAGSIIACVGGYRWARRDWFVRGWWSPDSLQYEQFLSGNFTVYVSLGSMIGVGTGEASKPLFTWMAGWLDG